MNPLLESTMLRPSPFLDDRGGVNVRGFCEVVEIGQRDLADRLGVSRQAVSQQLRPASHFVRPRTPKAREFWQKLDQVYTLLLALTDSENPTEDIRHWFKAPSKALDGERPLELVKRGDLDTLIRMLMDVLNAAHGG